jgi:hypothetical protein
MSEKYVVDVIMLSNNKYLIYPYLMNDRKYDFNEYRYLYYEWIDNLSIKSIENVIPHVDAWQIDGLVHLYMHNYGIENVRGGRYNKLVLSDEEKEFISQSIKYFAYGVDEATDELKKCRAVLQEIQDGKMDCDKVVIEYEKYNQLTTKLGNYAIDRGLLADFEWLISIMKTPVTKFATIQTRYYKLVQSLRAIYEKYLKTFEDGKQKIASCYKKHHAYFAENPKIAPITEAQLVNPIMYLDSRVIYSERNHDYCSKDELFLEIYTLVIYTFVNREDELLFDISQIDIDHINRVRKIMAMYPTA